jgi:hypothetical protein
MFFGQVTARPRGTGARDIAVTAEELFGQVTARPRGTSARDLATSPSPSKSSSAR